MSSTWPMVPLGEVLTSISRPETVDPAKTYRILGAHWYAHGLYTKDTLTGGEIQAPKVYRVEEGDFVYNRLFAWKGSFAVASAANHGCYVSNEFPCFAPKADRVNAHFLWRYFSREPAWTEALGLSTGGTPTSRNRLKEDAFLQLKIPLPPLAEQRRLVERIDALAAKIEEAKGLRQGADGQAMLLLGREVKEIFDKGKEIGWHQGKLGDYLVDASYGTSEKTCDDEAGTPIFRMGNIQDGRLRTTDLKYLHFSQRDRDAYLLEPGDILVNRTNSAELVGKCAVFNLHEEYGYASYIIRLRVDEHVSNPFLVAHFINSPIGRAYMLSEKKQMTGQANVNTAKLRAMPIWLPSRAEQDAVVEHIEEIRTRREELRRHQIGCAMELNAMLPAILDRAFRGEL